MCFSLFSLGGVFVACGIFVAFAEKVGGGVGVSLPTQSPALCFSFCCCFPALTALPSLAQGCPPALLSRKRWDFGPVLGEKCTGPVLFPYSQCDSLWQVCVDGGVCNKGPPPGYFRHAPTPVTKHTQMSGQL